MTQMRNLHWWTVEYGLIGTVDNYKQYGAGLLSSIGESKWCLSDKVKKIPYTIEASQQNFDVTKPQPQLFVTPDFAHLNQVLEDFADTLSVRRGGLGGLKRLIESGSLGTIELSTGLQISGIFSRIIEDKNSRNGIAYFQTSGESVLANRDKQLTGHGRVDHPDGIGSPLGYLKGYNLAIEDMSPRDLSVYNIHEGKRTRLEFEGGVIVDGRVITGSRNVHGKIQTIYFDECMVTYKDEVLFSPRMGIYCMTVGKEIISAFAGPADDDSFDMITHKLSADEAIPAKSSKIMATASLFEKAKDLRDQSVIAIKDIQDLFGRALEQENNNWLLFLDIYERSALNNYDELKKVIKKHLLSIVEQNDEVAHLINEGIEMIEEASSKSQMQNMI
jgi:phenylalanine-4-hydroxylase